MNIMSDIQKEKSMPPEQPDSSAGPSAMEVDEQPAGQSTNGVPLIADAPAPANITAESPVTETPTVHAETESEAVTPTSVEAPKDSHLNTGVDSVSSAPGTNTPVDPPMSAEAASDNYHAKEPNTVVLTSTSTPPVPATTGTPSSEGPAPTVPTSDEPGPTPMSGIEEASSQPSPAVNQDAQTSVPQDEAKALPSTEVPTISSQGPESGGANDVMTSIATDPLPLSTPAIASQLSTNPSTPSNEAPAPLQSSSAITSETPATAASTHPSSAAAKAGSQVDVTNQLSSTGDPEKAGTGEQDQNAGTASESVKLDAASTAEKPETPEMTDKKMKEAEETQAAAQARIKERSRRLAQVKAEKEELLRKKDKNVGELLLMLDDYRPLIPDDVTDFYLQKSGFECDDPRLKRLLSMAAQKFVSDIAADAFHYAKIRGSGGPSGAAAAASGSGGPAATGSGSTGAGTGGSGRAKTTLTMEDLNLALSDHGVNAKKPDYYF